MKPIQRRGVWNVDEGRGGFRFVPERLRRGSVLEPVVQACQLRLLGDEARIRPNLLASPRNQNAQDDEKRENDDCRANEFGAANGLADSGSDSVECLMQMGRPF